LKLKQKIEAVLHFGDQPADHAWRLDFELGERALEGSEEDNCFTDLLTFDSETDGICLTTNGELSLNTAAFLNECAESIVAQSFRLKEKIRLLGALKDVEDIRIAISVLAIKALDGNDDLQLLLLTCHLEGRLNFAVHADRSFLAEEKHGLLRSPSHAVSTRGELLGRKTTHGTETNKYATKPLTHCHPPWTISVRLKSNMPALSSANDEQCGRFQRGVHWGSAMARRIVRAHRPPNRYTLRPWRPGFGLNFFALYLVNIPGLGWSAYFAFALESMLFAIALAYRTRDSEQRAIKNKVHALSQLEKVVYPHQTDQTKNGMNLESTMPTLQGHACVLSFDIIGSTSIKHIKEKSFFRNVFMRCNNIISEGYDGKTMQASAYRVKELGDGFLCSVGYPFASISNNSANDAVELAKRFAQVLAEDSEILHTATPVVCGIGIALDTITGFYPEVGTKEYDIYGPALALAKRYEGMRHILFENEKDRSVLIVQEVVYLSLDPSYRAGFAPVDLEMRGLVVRDDPSATKLYYLFLDSAAAKQA